MIIDAHIHVAPPKLPGIMPMPVLKQPPEALVGVVREQLAASGATAALAMGCLNGGDDDPLGIAATLRLAQDVPGLYAVGVIDPRQSEPEQLRRVEKELATGRVKALKAYLGYVHIGADAPAYRAYYKLAEQFRLPVFFHTGDPHSPQAKLKFIHPLAVDEVAVDFPEVRFILAHFGHPWLTDAAEVIYKNVNVWADLSGLVIGDDSSFIAEERLDQLNDLRLALSRAVHDAERPNRFLYGSDWPQAPMAAYRHFIASALNSACHEQIFAENARRLFRLDG
jgi:uncharacterized protein